MDFIGSVFVIDLSNISLYDGMEGKNLNFSLMVLSF